MSWPGLHQDVDHMPEAGAATESLITIALRNRIPWGKEGATHQVGKLLHHHSQLAAALAHG
jgi:hypothetical protein